jgi:RHS repeat-associated protein
MNGVSPRSLNFGNPENKKKYNGIEETRDLDLNQYDALYRNLDPQIGRWWQIDPYTEDLQSYSPYESMGNSPISDIDPLGDFKTRFGAWWHRLLHGGDKIGKNDYGEWYVTKNRGVEVKDNGELVAKSAYYYGKGRDKYSTAREQLLEDADEEMIRNRLTREGIWDPNLSPEEARRNTLGLGVNVLLPSAIIKPATIAINAQKIVAKIKVIFENNPNQVYHVFRHIDEMGLSRSAVQAAIEEHLPTVASQIVEGKPLIQVIEVAGKKIQYTAFKLSDGTINVGRIHGIN